MAGGWVAGGWVAVGTGGWVAVGTAVGASVGTAVGNLTTKVREGISVIVKRGPIVGIAVIRVVWGRSVPLYVGVIVGVGVAGWLNKNNQALVNVQSAVPEELEAAKPRKPSVKEAFLFELKFRWAAADCAEIWLLSP